MDADTAADNLLTAKELVAALPDLDLNANTLKHQAQRRACRAWKKEKVWLFWRGDWEGTQAAVKP